MTVKGRRDRTVDRMKCKVKRFFLKVEDRTEHVSREYLAGQVRVKRYKREGHTKGQVF